MKLHVGGKCLNFSLTKSLENAVYKVAFVETTVGPLVTTAAVFLSHDVFALKADLALVPSLTPKAVLLVIHPVAFISGALRVDEGSLSVGHAVEPLALVDGAIRLNHSAEPLHLVHAKLALIFRAILPDENA